MIHYALKCAAGHGFESWFQSAAAFDTLRRAGHLTCAVCGSDEVEKELMAPRVAPARTKAAPPAPVENAPTARPLTGTPSRVEQALTKLRAHVEANSEYVGTDFAREARAIHDGDQPERPIWGEARPDEAKRLIEDGVPVAPLPFGPRRKVN